MERFSPRSSLRDRIVSIDVVRSEGHVSNVLPSPGAVLGLQTAGRVVTPNGPLGELGITGIQSEVRRYEYEGSTTTFLVRFRPESAVCLGLPAFHFSGSSHSLDTLLDRDARVRARELLEKARGARDGATTISLLEDFIETLPFERDRIVEHAVARLRSGAPGDEKRTSIAEVAREVGLSERQLERRFLQRVGIGPKQFSGLCRFERAHALTRSGASLSATALDAGYADQAHFIREFRKFAGTTPGRFARRPDLARV